MKGLISVVVMGMALAITPVNMAKASSDKQADELRKAVKLSMKDKVNSAEKMTAEMKSLLKQVFDTMGEARAEKDVVRINCLRDKTTAIKGLLRISEQAVVNLQEAAAKKDEEAAEHEYIKVTIARQKVQQLTAEAQTCAGEVGKYAGETEVEVEVDEQVEKFNPDKAFEEEPPEYERPQQSSPYE
ncbi:MAG: hypothetical protein GXP49_06145 [Deltaproteobacteria bacterium]|nr:hypothetical protein [Deltaproteobacteria bacterium]